ncbi:MAG: SDR family oxidoreductase [bacterium]|nr:SDR family oxidoreductase [bacterium]
MKVLFIGGTGTISTACTALAAARGIELYLLNRGQRQVDLPPGVQVLKGDINEDRAGAAALLAKHTFDVVVDWIAFRVGQVERDIELFGGRTGQFIFISSASAYQKPITHHRITEATPLANPFWQYSRDKIACEDRLMQEYRQNGFPMTVVRPSHTYGPASLPTAVGGGATVVSRIRAGKKVIVHGDGESLWVMTHNTDFAKAFVGLLGHPKSIGHAFQITSDEVLTWNQIYASIGRACGAVPQMVHVPSDLIHHFDPATGAGLLGDKACSVVFDNSKVRELVPDYVATVPFARGVEQCITWLDAEPARLQVDAQKDAMLERIIAAYERAWG